MFVSKPKWLEMVIESYQQDTYAKQLLTELSISSPNAQGYSLHEGVIKYKAGYGWTITKRPSKLFFWRYTLVALVDIVASLQHTTKSRHCLHGPI